MKILVTGASGFIGFHLVRKLLGCVQPHEMTCLVRSPQKVPALEALGVSVVRGDLRNTDCLVSPCADADLVFHLAARVPFGTRRERTIDLHNDNVESTRNLLEACPATLRRLVYVSSINAVNRAIGDRCNDPITEQSPCHPQRPYGRSKLLAERLVTQVAAAKAIPYIIIRPPSIVYGSGCNTNSLIARLIHGVAEGSFLTTLNFPGRFSLIHVTDLVEGIVKLGFADQVEGETFGLCDETPRSIPEIVREIAIQLGMSPNCRSLPESVYRFVNRTASAVMRLPWIGRGVPFQLLMLLRDQAVMSSEKARRDVGFETRISLPEGLRKTIPWVLQTRSSESFSAEPSSS